MSINLDNSCIIYTGSGSGEFRIERSRFSLWGAPECVADFGPEFSGSFVLSAFENMSTALTNGFVTLRLIKTCPCGGFRYSHRKPSRLHLEHAGRKRSHWSRKVRKGSIICCWKDIGTFTFIRLQMVQRPALFGSPTICSILFLDPSDVALCYCDKGSSLAWLDCPYYYCLPPWFIEKVVSCDYCDRFIKPVAGHNSI
jgi:hypothetical protein